MASNEDSANEGLPKEIRTFLGSEIHSVEQLEILLLLRRTAPRRWTSAEICAELRGNPVSAKNRLELLFSKQLIQYEPETFVFAPPDRTLADLVEALDVIYSQRRARIIEFIVTKAVDPLQDFANAFKLRKD